MTPSEVETAARNTLNAASDTYFSQAAVFELISQAEFQLASRANCIRAKDTSITTVIGTRTYAFPTNVIALKRVEWNGKVLQKIDFREDDLVTARSSDTTVTGEPTYYSIWNDTIYLREIPNAAQTLTLYCYKQPTALTVSPVSSSLSVPARYHPKIINYVRSFMCAQDKDYDGSRYYLDLWDKDLEEAVNYEKRKERADRMAYVKNEDQMLGTEFGMA